MTTDCLDIKKKFLYVLGIYDGKTMVPHTIFTIEIEVICGTVRYPTIEPGAQ